MCSPYGLSMRGYVNFGYGMGMSICGKRKKGKTITHDPFHGGGDP